MESRLRVGLVRAGLPAPLVQFVITDEYDFPLARVDLAYPAAKLAIEYDGAHHFDARRARATGSAMRSWPSRLAHAQVGGRRRAGHAADRAADSRTARFPADVDRR